MSYFKAQELKKITLLSDKKYWIEVIADLKYGDIKAFANVSQDGNIDFAARADVFLQTVIKNWNLDDEDGNVLPVTPENIDKLAQADAVMILEAAGSLVESDEQKKTL